MAIGDSSNILARVKATLPFRWFAYAAPLRDAVLGGLSDGAAWCYSLIVYARTQSRLLTSSGPFLDLIAYDFLGRYLVRRSLSDNAFRARIKATILQERVTRAGMVNAVTNLTGKAPIIFEPWNTGDTAGWDVAMGYDLAGGWGDLTLTGQAFVAVTRPGVEGIPGVSGYDCGGGGWDGGAIEWTDPASMIVGYVTDQDIYDTVKYTKPTGVIAWTAIVSGSIGGGGGGSPGSPSLDFSDPNNSQYLPLV